MINLNVAVTGHRDLLDEERPRLENEVRAFFLKLQKAFPDLDLQLLSPLAEGADRLVTRVAGELDIPVTAVLPMDQYIYERDFVSDESVEVFRAQLHSAARVITLPEVTNSNQNKSPGGVLNRERQYAQLGVFLSNHCQILLALWDGKYGEAEGGTGRVVHYHLTAVMQGFTEEQAAAELLSNNENDLAYHLVCSRDRPGGGTADGLVPGEASWITSLHGRQSGSRIPDEYRQMLDSLQDFERDRRLHAAAIRKEGHSLLDDLPDRAPPEHVLTGDEYYRAADWLAVFHQQRVNRSLLATYSLAGFMGLVFLLYSEYSGPSWMVLMFLALFFAGVGFHYVGERRQWHRKYLDYRGLAEGLRVQIYWSLSGVVDALSPGFAYDTFLHKQDVQLAWIRHVMRSVSLLRVRGEWPERAWVGWVIRQWIGTVDGNGGQLAYYSRKEVENSIRYRRTSRLGKACLWSGVLVAFAMFLVGGRVSEANYQVMLVLMAALPLIAGIRDAYSHKKAEKELIRQYGFMSRIFSNASKLLAESDDIEFQRRVLRAVGEAALEEGAEWILMHRERPLEHSGIN